MLVDMMLKNKLNKFENTHFHASSLWNGLNWFQFGIQQVATYNYRT
jgi:hypothetical protein